ncbi:translation initiation factor eIF-2B [Chloroflexota bacterium]
MKAVDTSSDIISLIDEIKNDKTSGASQLARKAVKVLQATAQATQASSAYEFWQEQKEISNRLIFTRPVMVSIFNIVSRFLATVAVKVTDRDLASIKAFAITKADILIEESLQAVAQIAQHVTDLVNKGDTIMTHSYSSTVMAGLKAVYHKHKDITVITTRSGPSRSGEITIRQLGRYGIPVTFIDDTAVGPYISLANKAVIGADRVCANGKLVNSIGTYQLALVAERASVPIYVLCETLKFETRLKGVEVDLEEKDPSELLETANIPARIKVKNPHFDITPLEMITAIITENGVLAPIELLSMLKNTPT